MTMYKALTQNQTWTHQVAVNSVILRRMSQFIVWYKWGCCEIIFISF